MTFGAEGGGGGGAGLGGAIFVASGGQFVLNGSLAINGNRVAGGAGAITSGSAYGSGLFLQGNGTLTFTPGSGQAQTISDNIADETGSGGGGVGAFGKWGLTLNGPGTLTLAGANTYTGYTLVSAGTLQASSANALGSSPLILDAGATLQINNGTISGPLDLFSTQSTFIGGATLAFTASANTSLPALAANALLLAADAAQPLVLNVMLAEGFTPAAGYQWTFLTTVSGIQGLTDLSAILAPPGWSVKRVNGANALALVYLGPASPPIISSFKFIGNGVLQLTFTGPQGNGYRVWAGSNLAVPIRTGAWTLLSSGIFGGEVVTCTDTQTGNYPQRFYVITVP